MESSASRKAAYAQIRKEKALANVSGYATSFEQRMPTVPDRPARVQIEQRRQLQQAEHIGEYNIWYNRYQGENGYEKAPRAATRVCIETDAGLTRADYTNPNAHICLHFARGGCTQGKDCTFRHCVPTEEDETQTDAPHDVFGRNRHGSFRDDMGGTGTWNKECKTLYVGRICSTPPEAELLEIIVRHFGEFGLLETVRVIKAKGIAFVTYKMRCAAEFAKEAMMEQTLDHDEQINVRWAYDDPNPRAQAIRLRNNAQLMLNAMEKRGDLEALDRLEMEPYADESDPLGGYGGGDDGEPAAKRHAAEAAVVPTRWEVEAAAVAAAAAAEAQKEEVEKALELQEIEANKSKLDQILAGIGGEGQGDESAASQHGGETANVHGAEYADFAHAVGLDTTTSRDAQVEMPPGVFQTTLPQGWQEFRDPASGQNYYYCYSTGETTWARPSR